MKVIAIYVQNEEMAALKPMADVLTSRGARVLWRALKFDEVVRADLVLTLPQHKQRVERLFAASKTPVSLIENEEVPEELEEEEDFSLTEFPDTVPIMIVSAADAEPRLHLPPEETPAVEEPVKSEEQIQALVPEEDSLPLITVGEPPTHEHKTPRRRKLAE